MGEGKGNNLSEQIQKNLFDTTEMSTFQTHLIINEKKKKEEKIN